MPALKYSWTVRLDPPDPGFRAASAEDRREYYKWVVTLVAAGPLRWRWQGLVTLRATSGQ